MAGNATAAEVYRMVLAQVPRLGNSEVKIRREAAEAIYEICSEYKELAAEAVLPLLNCLADPDEAVREKAQWGLTYCGKAARSQLRRRLSSPNRLVRLHAVRSLGNGYKAGFREKRALRGLLTDDDSEVRSSAAWALSVVGARDARTIRRLRAMINCPLAADRSAALHALGNLGRNIDKKASVREWFDDVEPALNDSDDKVRWSAYYVLGAIKAPAIISLPLWINGLGDSSERIVSMSLDGFADAATESDIFAAIELLANVVERQISASHSACKVLARVGDRAQAAVPSLINVLKSESPHLVAAAAVALWRIDRRVDESLSALANLMKTPGPGVAETICDAVYQIGPAAAPLTDLVLNLLAVEDYDLQWAATDALGAIASADPKVLDSLINALGHPSGLVCRAAMNSLLTIGVEAIPALIDALDKVDDRRREFVADLLAQFGPKAFAASDKLILLIGGSDPNVRAWCAIALGKVAGSKSAVPVLVDALEHLDGAHIRRQAIESLGNIGASARDATPILTRLLGDSDEETRAAAADALSKIAS